MIINPTNIIIVIIIVIGIIVGLALMFRKGGSKDKASRKTVPNKQVYIGNLPYRASERDLKEYFSKFGSIEQAKVVKNRQTGRSKGFAFVTFSSIAEANNSLAAHGVELMGRTLVVRIAKPR